MEIVAGINLGSLGNSAQITHEVAHPNSAHTYLMMGGKGSLCASYWPKCSDGPGQLSVILHWQGRAFKLCSIDPTKDPAEQGLIAEENS